MALIRMLKSDLLWGQCFLWLSFVCYFETFSWMTITPLMAGRVICRPYLELKINIPHIITVLLWSLTMLLY